MLSNNRTAEETKSEHFRLMGESLGRVYDALWQQVAWVHGKWNEYIVLFGTQESRVILLNKAAPTFFRLVEDSLWENVLLHIARLTDQASTGRKLNLTIQSLPTLVGRPEVRQDLEGKIERAMRATVFARDWRNRHIAHNDLELSISERATPLEFASRKCVKEALAALSDVLNVVSSAYLESTSFFETLDGDALSLLYVLDDGLRADDQRRERLRSGTFDPEHVKRRDL